MKTSGIGGQAVIEGVMMKNKDEYAVAIRKSDNTIEVKKDVYVALSKRVGILKIPVLRGVASFIDSLILGMKTLNYSARFYEEEEKDSKNSKNNNKNKNNSRNNNKSGNKNNGKNNSKNNNNSKNSNRNDAANSRNDDSIFMAITMMLSIIIAVGIFVLLPYYVTELIKTRVTSPIGRSIIESIIRLLLFIIYISAISLMKDIKRVYMYHGAEHKVINCVEKGYELNVANARKQTKEHKRCGTSFLLYVVLLCCIFFVFIDVDAAWLRMLLRIVLVPVIAGVAYEFIRFAGNTDNQLMNILSKPGLWLQGLTTKEPDDDMLEVAIASVNAVFDWKAFQKGLSSADNNKSAASVKKESSDKKTETAKEDKSDIKDEAAKKNKADKKDASDKDAETAVTEEIPVEDIDSEDVELEDIDVKDIGVEDISVEDIGIEDIVVENDTVESKDTEKTTIKTNNNNKSRRSVFRDSFENVSLDDEDDDEDDEILKALDRYFTMEKAEEKDDNQ